MSQEIAVRDGGPQDAALASKLRYAEALSQSNLLPSAFRYQPANVLVGAEVGETLGLSPMAAIQNVHVIEQNVHVIEGKPTPSAELVKALVRRAGHKLRVWYEPLLCSTHASQLGLIERPRGGSQNG